MDGWQHLRAILLLPGMVLGVIPGVIVYFTGLDTFGLWNQFPATGIILPILGLVFIGLGLSLMFATIRLFGTVGNGTLAPWNPPQRLVVQGIYRHVRNPMMLGVYLNLLGEATITASLPVLQWLVVFIVATCVVIPIIEEPGLARRFGDDYLNYKRNVPRWIPRWTPWDQD